MEAEQGHSSFEPQWTLVMTAWRLAVNNPRIHFIMFPSEAILVNLATGFLVINF